MIGKQLVKDTFYLLYDRIPECHRLTPHVTLDQGTRWRGTHERE
jgi:hypothetical protein